MILVGQYDSPYVRRVAVSLRVLGFEYRHDTRSVFADFDRPSAQRQPGMAFSYRLSHISTVFCAALSSGGSTPFSTTARPPIYSSFSL